MTESEWVECDKPVPMLEFLPGKASDRKLRLFACATANRLLAELADEDKRRKIEAVERFTEHADLKGFSDVMAHVRSPVTGYYYNQSHPDSPPAVMPGSVLLPGMDVGLVESEEGLFYQCDAEYFGVVVNVVTHSRTRIEKLAVLFRIILLADADFDPCLAPLAHLARDIFGNPFRQITINTTWQTPTILSLAQAAYDNRILPAGTLDPARLAILADALEEEGCGNADILNHLRQSGDHVWGCWVLDLLLGKE